MKLNRMAVVVALIAALVPMIAFAKGWSMDDPVVLEFAAVQEAETAGLMANDGVFGTAVGVDEGDGELAIVVLVDRDHGNVADLVRSLPPQLRGKAVRVLMTDTIRAFAKPAPRPTVDHKAKQAIPVQLGTSGGWTYDLANGYCCGGTLGSLIQVNGVQYILSNYHVLNGDIVPGGNSRVVSSGDPVIQPGLIDVGCVYTAAQGVAYSVEYFSLPYSNVDAAIARVAPGMVRTDGAILEIGPLSSQTAAAYIGQPVKKSGRTTGLTTSKVSALNATINITYENECAGGTAFTQTFTGQIVVTQKASKFLAAGDSGSLLVQNVSTAPKAIGLLYAGSSSTAIANPIGEVLGYIGAAMGGTASMVGN